MASTTATVASKRRHVRVPLRCEVRMISARGTFIGHSGNLSRGGAFVEPVDADALNVDMAASVELHLRLPEVVGEVPVSGRVVWQGPRGLGIAFEDVPFEHARLLKGVLADAGGVRA